MTYREFVQPHHPLIGEIFGSREEGDPLAGSIATLRRLCRYVPEGGVRRFDDLQREWNAWSAEPRPLNCLGLSCLLVSRLRALTYSSSEAFVALGTRRDLPPNAGGCRFHAWTLLRMRDALLWIDPATLRPEQVAGEALLERYNIHVLFNDERSALFPPEKRRLMVPPSGDGFRLCVYGAVDAGLRSAVSRSGVRRGIRSFFGHAGDAFLGDDSSAHLALEYGIATRITGGYGPGPRLVMVTERGARTLRGQIEPALDRYLAIATATVTRLRRDYEACAAAKAFPWSAVVHSVVGGMFLDLAVGAQLGLAADVQRAHGANVVWAFEGIEAENAFGVVQFSDAVSRTSFFQLWHRRIARRPISLSAGMVKLLAAAGTQTTIRPTSEWSYLHHTQLLRRAGSTSTPQVPVFTGSDSEHLLDTMFDGADRIVREVMVPGVEIAARDPEWAHLTGRTSLKQAVARLVLEHGIDRVVDAAVIPPFPSGDIASISWGRWVWQEPSNGRSLMPLEAPATIEKAAS